MARKLVANQDNTSTSSQTEPLTREVARPIFGESVLAIDYNFAEKDYLDDDIDFSRASNATQVGSDGYIKFAPNNLLPYSENFEHSDWVKYNVTATASTITDPFGGTGAFEFKEDSSASNNKLLIDSHAVVNGGTYIFSLYAKAKELSILQLIIGNVAYAGGNNHANFDLTNGVVTATGGGCIAKIEKIGTDGWYRCSIGDTTSASGNTQPTIVLQNSPTSLRANSYTGNGTDGVYIFGAMSEQTFDKNASPSAYLKSSGGAEHSARFDYSADGYGNSKGLLIEEARTNLFTYSQDLSQWSWLSNDGHILANAAISPSGAKDATKIIPNATDGNKLFKPPSIPTASVDSTYCMSIYVKKAGHRYFKFYFNDSTSRMLHVDLDTGQGTAINTTTGAGYGVEEVGNDWYRVWFAHTIVGSAVGSIYMTSSNSISYPVSFTGDGSSGVLVWGAQFEQGSFVSSLIPSFGNSSARSGDVAKVDGTNFSRFYKQGTGGAWIVDSTELAEDRTTQSSPFSVYESSSSALRVGPKVGGGPTNTIAAYYQDGGDMIYSAGSSLGTVTKGVKSKIGITFQTNDGAFTRDGKNPNVDTSIANIYSPTELRIGGDKQASPTTVFCGHIARLRYYNKRISNNKLQKETDTPFLLNKYPRAKAAHSLRALTDDSSKSPCVSVRRSYDNSEKSWTPNQVSNGELEADFQSEKQTTLPLDVSVEADEMIVGGDFTDLVTNGDFAADSDWTKGTGWTISGGTATRTDASAYTALAQSILTTGKTYTVTYTVSGASGGGVRARLGGDYIGSYNGNGTHTVSGVCGQYSDFQLMGETNFAGSVDNVSVVEGSWAITDGGQTVEFSSGGIRISTDGTLAYATQGLPVVKGKTYRVTGDIKVTSGSGSVVFQGIQKDYNSTQSFSFDVVATTTSASSTLMLKRSGGGAASDFIFDNISVKEVNPIATGFSTRKINSSYTGKAMRCRNQGNVEVEVGFDDNNEISLSSPVTNTSQNLLAFSEDFGAWGVQNASVRTSGQSDPNGGQNAWLISGGTAAAGGVTLDVAVTNDKYYTLSGYFKKGTSTKTRLSIHYKYIEWDWSASGVPSLTANSSEPSNITFTPVGTDGWYRISFVWEATATATRTINIDPDRNNTNKTVYAFGAQLEETQYSSTGTELMTNGDFSNGSTGWTLSPFGQTVEVQNEALRIATPDGTFCKAEQVINTTAGKKYTTTANLTVTSGGLSVVFGAQTNHTSSGTISVDRIATGSSYTWTAKRFNTSGANDVIIDDISVKEYDPIVSDYSQTPVVVSTHHSTDAVDLQSFAGKENLIAYTSTIMGNGWSNNQAEIASTGHTDPFGGTTAILARATGTDPYSIKTDNNVVAGQKYVFSMYMKGVGTTIGKKAKLQIWFGVGTATGPTTFDSNLVLTGEWQRFELEGTPTGSGTVALRFDPVDTAVVGEEVLLSSPQLNTNSAKDYVETVGDNPLTGDVHCVVWMDQNLGHDATQDTANNQPRLVKGSELVTSGGKPALDFDGAGSGNTDHLDIAFLRGNSRFDMFAMYDTDDTNFSILHDPQNGNLVATTQDGSSTTWKNSNFADADSKAYVNGTILSADTRDVLHDQGGQRKLVTFENCYTSTLGSLNIGLAAGDTSWNFSGKICELIMFPNMNPSQKRFNIEQNMLNHFDVNLVTNGTFDDDISSWTQMAGATISYQNGTIKVQTTNYIGAQQFVTVAPYSTYRITFDVVSTTTSTGRIYIGTSSDKDAYGNHNGLAVGTHTFDVTTINNSSLQLRLSTTDASGNVNFDNVKVQEVGTSGYVTKLYDQTGNNCHALQATAAYQPQIVSGGDLIKSGNHPAWEHVTASNMELFGKLKAARIDAWFVAETSDDIYIYPANYATVGDHGFVAQDGSTHTTLVADYGGGNEELYVNGTLITGAGTTRDEVHTALNGRKLVHHQDADTADWEQLQMGGYATFTDSSFNFQGKFSEWIWYDSDQSGNKTGIESNINTHYNIY